jgi:hypothetical protein
MSLGSIVMLPSSPVSERIQPFHLGEKRHPIATVPTGLADSRGPTTGDAFRTRWKSRRPQGSRGRLGRRHRIPGRSLWNEPDSAATFEYPKQRARPEKWPDPAGQLPVSGSLAATGRRTVKNLIHHLDPPNLRPKRVGLPCRSCVTSRGPARVRSVRAARETHSFGAKIRRVEMVNQILHRPEFVCRKATGNR